MPLASLTKRGLESLPPVKRRTIFYDRDLIGFGLRVSPSTTRAAAPSKSWIVEYRVGGGRSAQKRRMVIGDTVKLDPEQARREAKAVLARVELGGDPANDRARSRRAETVADLIESYIRDHVEVKRKATTGRTLRSLAKRHVTPSIGSRKVDALHRADISKLHAKIGAKQPEIANRTLSMIRAAYNWGARHGLLSEDFRNPCLFIEPFRERGRERYLSSAEFARLGDALRLAETTGIPWAPDPTKKVKHAPKALNRVVVFDKWGVAAIRLLIFTGCRLREILNLRWREVDLERGVLLLPDSKTGRKVVVLGADAIEVLRSLDLVGEFVILGASLEKPRADLNRPWARIRAHAKLDDVRLHDLRHTFASVGAGSGLGLPIIGRLLGHASVATTQRYAHLADDPLRRGADVISARIKSALGG
ncbi:MAG: tyrosine-type recombinase/integrase [Caulobacteraceae bacterium]